MIGFLGGMLVGGVFMWIVGATATEKKGSGVNEMYDGGIVLRTQFMVGFVFLLLYLGVFLYVRVHDSTGFELIPTPIPTTVVDPTPTLLGR